MINIAQPLAILTAGYSIIYVGYTFGRETDCHIPVTFYTFEEDIQSVILEKTLH